MQLKLIGITGHKQHGKDVICRTIQNLHPNSARLAFADGVKQEVAEITGIPFFCIEPLKSHLRPLLQVWGTDYRRKLCGDDYWVKQLDSRRKKLPEDTLTIVPDVRFANEFAYIQENKGVVLGVQRPDFGADDAHESEQYINSLLQRCEHVFTNTELADLKLDVATWFKTHC